MGGISLGSSAKLEQLNGIGIDMPYISGYFKAKDAVENFNINVENTLKAPFDAIGDLYSGAKAAVVDAGSSAYNYISGRASAVLNDASNMASSIYSQAEWILSNSDKFVSDGVTTVGNFLNGLGESIQSGVEDTKASVIEIASSLGGDAMNIWNHLSTGDFAGALEATGTFAVKLEATAQTARMMLVNGIANVAEGLVDFADILGTIGATIPCALIDGVSYLATGETLGVTEKLWDNTMSFVATEYVNDFFKMYFTEMAPGKVLNDMSYLKYGSGVYNLGVGVSEVATTIALSIPTFGGYGAAVGTGKIASTGVTAGVKAAGKTVGKEMAKRGAVISAAKGMSGGAEEAWNQNMVTINDGNDTKMNFTHAELNKIQELNTGESYFKEVLMLDENGNEIKSTIEFVKNEDGSLSAKVDGNTYGTDIKETMVLEGLGYGAVNGIWEGAQWYLGGKFAGKGLKTIAADTISGAVDVPLRTLYQGIYSDEGFEQRFQNNGGVQGTILNAAIAGSLSSLGELPSSREFLSREVSSQKNNVLQSFKDTGSNIIENGKNFFENIAEGNITSSLTVSSVFDRLFRRESREVASEIEKAIPKTDINSLGMRASELLSDNEVKKSFKDFVYNLENSNAMLFDDITFKQEELYKVYNELFGDSGLSDAFKYLEEYGFSHGQGSEYVNNVIEKYIETGNASFLTRGNGVRDLITSYSTEDLSLLLNLKKQFDKVLKSSDIEGRMALSTDNFFLYNSYHDGDKIIYDKVSGTSKYGVNQGTFGKMFRNNETCLKMINKLKEQGFSAVASVYILRKLDSVGACSYAAVCNEIFNTFRNNADLFEKVFGFSMYNGKILNEEELLLDMYTFLNDTKNGGKLFGNGKIVDNNFGHQLYLSTTSGNRNDLIQKYFDSKGISYNAEVIAMRNESDGKNFDAVTGERLLFDVETLKQAVSSKLSDGENVSLVIGGSEGVFDYFDMKSLSNAPDYSSSDWPKNLAHAMFVTGVNDQGVTLSSWGNPYFLNWDAFKFSTFVFSASNISLKK